MSIADLKSFFQNKRILITGHTGFKGSWLYAILESWGAEVYGLGLAPKSENDLFTLLGIYDSDKSFIHDISDFTYLENLILQIKPDIVFHLAAQALVLKSYANPVETFQTNVIGTLNLLEVFRKHQLKPIIVNITTDKCYANPESGKAFQEDDPLGGKDPYSASKAMVEILSNSYYQSFFHSSDITTTSLRLATVRAGNVIGGGDWSENRLIPDFVNSLSRGEEIVLRNPDSVRPWQFVLEPLYAYCLLAYKLSEADTYCSAWNIGPEHSSCIRVLDLAKLFLEEWGSGEYRVAINSGADPESKLLTLDSTKAKNELGWRPVLDIKQAIAMTAAWYKVFLRDKAAIKDFTKDQLKNFFALYDSPRYV